MKRFCKVFVSPTDQVGDFRKIIRHGGTEAEINDYAKENNLTIISISPQDATVVWVIFEREKSGE